MLWFELVPSVSEPCYTTHCAMWSVGKLDKCQWNHKNLWPNRDSDSDLLRENFFSLQLSRGHSIKNENSWQKYTHKKEKQS